MGLRRGDRAGPARRDEGPGPRPQVEAQLRRERLRGRSAEHRRLRDLAVGRQPERGHRPGRRPGLAAAAGQRLLGVRQRRSRSSSPAWSCRWRSTTARRRCSPPSRSSCGRSTWHPMWRGALLEGLKGVVTGGTAAETFDGFALDQMPVAGKTGTAEVDGKADTSVFAAFAPRGRAEARGGRHPPRVRHRRLGCCAPDPPDPRAADRFGWRPPGPPGRAGGWRFRRRARGHGRARRQ